MLFKFLQIIKSLTEKERWLLGGTAVIFIVSGIFFGLQSFYRTTVPQPVEGGSYTEAIIGQPIAINPFIAGDNDADRDLIQLLFASLSDISSSIKSDEAQKVWTIALKSDLVWSDSKPITSDDVLFTISVIQDPDAHSPFFATWQGVVAEKNTEHEVKLTLKNPYAFFSDNIKDLKIVPQHIFDNIPPQNFRLSDYNLKPVGSGPYTFVGYTKRPDGFIEKYQLAANPDFAGQKAYIQKFTVSFFANKNDALAAFNNKEIDGIGGLEQADVAKLTLNAHLITASRPRYYAIFLNQSTGIPLKEQAVRLALNYATNRDGLLAAVLNGQGQVEKGPIPPSIEGYDDSVFTDAVFNPDLASSTLEKAGWKMNANGVREKTIQKSKITLEFDIIVPEVKFLVDTVKQLQQDWHKIGINLNPVVLKPSDVITSAIKPRNYQMVIFGNTLNNNPDVFSFWHSSQRFDPGLNLSLFSDKTVDGLLESVRQDTKGDTRDQSLSKMQKLINDQKPAVFLYSPQYIYATSKPLGGFSAKSVAIPADRFDNVQGWYLKTARVFQ